MRYRRSAFAVGAATLAVAGAACGGGSSSGGGTGASGTDGQGAKYAPASSIVFFDANVDQGSDAWKKMIALGSKFPSWPKLVAQVDKALADNSDGGSFNTKVKPWLGGEVSLAVTHIDAAAVTSSTASSASDSAKIVAYVQSTDDKKATAALQADMTKTGSSGDFTLYTSKNKAGDTSSPSYIAIGKGAVLISNSQADLQTSIDAGTGKGSSLQDAKDFKSTMGELPSSNLMVGYVNTPALKPLLQAASAQGSGGLPAGSSAQLQAQLAKLGSASGAAFAATPADDGIHFASFTQTTNDSTAAALADQKTTLGNRVPSNALAFVGFHDLGPALAQVVDAYAKSSPQIAQQIAQGEAALGVSIKGDIVPLLSGEHALFVTGGVPPTVSLLLKPANAAKGADTLQRLSKLIGSQTGLTFKGDANGEQAKQGSNTFAWHRSGDVIALSNDPQSGAVQGSGLLASDKFTQLQKAAGAPASSTASVYLDVPALVTLGQAAAGNSATSASDKEAIANLQHLGGLLGWTAIDGKKVTGDLFLQVK
jgi:hypothetical protein